MKYTEINKDIVLEVVSSIRYYKLSKKQCIKISEHAYDWNVDRFTLIYGFGELLQVIDHTKSMTYNIPSHFDSFPITEEIIKSQIIRGYHYDL